MVFATFGVGQLLWALLWFSLFFVWVMLVFRVFGDLMQSPDLSGTAKVVWTVVVIVLPYIGAFAYLAVRGRGIADRAAAAAPERAARHASSTTPSTPD